MMLVDGDTSVNKLVFLTTRVENKDSATLVSSGPHGHIHFWNVFNGGLLMAHFSAVCITRRCWVLPLINQALVFALKIWKKLDSRPMRLQGRTNDQNSGRQRERDRHQWKTLEHHVADCSSRDGNGMRDIWSWSRFLWFSQTSSLLSS